MSKSYSKTELQENELMKDYKGPLRNCLIETLSVLPKDEADDCLKRIQFREMDRWGQYNYKIFKDKVDNVVFITKETLSLNPFVAKFIFLHEIGHYRLKHRYHGSNREKRERQDKKADEFARERFPDWKRYFSRDKHNNLNLTELGNKQKLRNKP